MASSSSSSSSSSYSSLCLRVRASWDTQQMVSYNPNAPRKLKKTATVPANPPPPPLTLSPSTAKMVESVSQLLKRQNPPPEEPEKESESYLGYDRWLPNPPKVERPRSIFNAASLAYLGDCIYELYARRHFLFPPLSIEDYNDSVTAVVRCEAQDALLQKLLSDNFLTQQERELLRWGKNVGSSKTRTKKRAGTAVYNRASSFETLIGYLYLTNTKRLDEIMQKIGFSTDSSIQFMFEEFNGKKASGREDSTRSRLS